MSGKTFVVGLDSCVFIEGIKVPNGLGNAVLRLAAAKVFRVLLVPKVESEVRSQLRDIGKEGEFDTLLQHCEVERCNEPTEEEVRLGKAALRGLITHAPDLLVAVSVRLEKPRFFVTSNTRDRKDWNGAQPLRNALSGVLVKTPRQFLLELGVQPPAKVRHT